MRRLSGKNDFPQYAVNHESEIDPNELPEGNSSVRIPTPDGFKYRLYANGVEVHESPTQPAERTPLAVFMSNVWGRITGS